MVGITDAVLGLGMFIRDLPEYYKTISFKDPLCAVIMSIHAIMIVGLILSMKSALGSLLIIFVLLALSYLTSWIDGFLRDNVTLLLEHKYITRNYFLVKGKFVAAVWTIPMFFYTVFFSLCLILTLLKEIIQECRKKDSNAGSSSHFIKQEETEENVDRPRSKEDNTPMHNSTSSAGEHGKHGKHHGGHGGHTTHKHKHNK